MGKIKDQLIEQGPDRYYEPEGADAAGTSMSPPQIASAEHAFFLERERLLKLRRLKTGKFLWVPVRSLREIDRPKRAQFSKLSRATDWVPFKATRKQQKKLLADESAEISDLLAAGRTGVARWRKCLVWLAWSRYLLASPFGVLIRALARTHIG